MYRFCWSYSTLWFETSNPISPYTLFTSLFALIGFWLLIELCLTYKGRQFSLLTISQLSIAGIFLTLMAIVFINFHTAYKVEQGEASPHELIFKSEYFIRTIEAPRMEFKPIQVSYGNKEQPEIPQWQDYMYAQTCGKGIDITGISQDKYRKLKIQYKILVNKLYQETNIEQ